MVTKNTKPGEVVNLRKTSPYSIKASINKSTYQKYEPRRKDLYIRDTKLIGFYIRIRSHGKKTYNCEAKLNGIGKKVTVSIGDCSLFTAQQARKMAQENLVKIKTGVNPKEEFKKQLADGHTLVDLAEEYVSIRELAPNTVKDYLYRIPNQMPKLCNKDIKDLTVDDFVSWWSGAKAKVSREVALRYVSSLLQYAIARKYIDENAAQDFRKGVLGGIKKRPPKQTHISKLKIEDWVESLVRLSPPHPDFKDFKGPDAYWEEPSISETTRDYVLFLLVTGKRKSEASNLIWKDIDFDVKTITIQKTKSGKIDILPMTNLLWHMLKYRFESKTKHKEYVFPNKYGSGPIVDIRRTLEKINTKAGIGHTTAHDLRRTFATMTRELGMTNQDTAILLNHAKRDVTEGYVITSREIKRDNLDEVTWLILDHIEGWTKVYWYGGDQGHHQGPDAPIEEREYYI